LDYQEKNDLENRQNEPVDSGAMPEETEEKNVYPAEQRDNIGNNNQDKNGVLDIVYGVLFDPVRTFAGLAQRPPVGAAVIIFVVLNLAEALMGLLTAPRYFGEMPIPGFPGMDAFTHSLLPLFSAGGFIFSVVKWFVMAGLLHLLAELLGGRGVARGVFVVYGVAGLPAVFMIPVDIILALIQAGSAVLFFSGLLSLGIFIWSVVLLIIGVREVHRFSTGRATLAVLMPGLALVVLFIIGMMFIGTTFSTMPRPILF